MKVGDLVMPISASHRAPVSYCKTEEGEWAGIIIGFTMSADPAKPYPIVYWNDEYPAEAEFPHQITVVS